MAAVKNEIDKILTVASPRILPVLLPSNIGIPWTNVDSRPTDIQIMNELQRTHANLVPALRRWTNYGTNFIYPASNLAVDGTVLVIPAGSTGSSDVVISSATAQKLFAGQTYTLSFQAITSGASRTLTFDLFPDTLPQTSFTITTTLTQFSCQWTPAHADINGTVLLRALPSVGSDQIEICDIQLEIGSVRTPWKPNVSDIIGINNQITPTNYATYMAASSISSIAFSQNPGSTSGSGTHVDTSISFDSKGEKVLLQFTGQLTVAGLATYGTSYIQIYIKQNGTNVYIGGTLGSSNVAGASPAILSFTDFLYIPSPGTGINVFTMELNYINTGDGMSGAGFKPSLQIIGLNR